MTVTGKEGDFVRLSENMFGRSAWLCLVNREDSIIDLKYSVQPYVNNLIYLSSVPLYNSKGDITDYGNGIYYLKSATDSIYTLRDEIWEDMPCGMEGSKPTDMSNIKEYTLRVEDLNNDDGSFKIKLAYQKGC